MRTVLIIFVLAVTASSQIKASRAVAFFGDSETKLYYPIGCAEVSKIKSGKSVALFDNDEAVQKGFTLVSSCGKPTANKTVSVPSPITPRKPKDYAWQTNGRTATDFSTPKNLMVLRSDMNRFIRKRLHIPGEVSMVDLSMESELPGFRNYDTFMLADESGAWIFLVMTRGSASKSLQDSLLNKPDRTQSNWGMLSIMCFGRTYGSKNICELSDYQLVYPVKAEPEN